MALTVMNPLFKPQVTVASLITTLASIGTAAVSVTTPIHHLLRNYPDVADRIQDVALILAALGSLHLAAARSVLKSVDTPT